MRYLGYVQVKSASSLFVLTVLKLYIPINLPIDAPTMLKQLVNDRHLEGVRNLQESSREETVQSPFLMRIYLQAPNEGQRQQRDEKI